MMILKPHWPRWAGRTVVVVASGPGTVARHWPAAWPIIAVNDAVRLYPRADILYACDEAWWNHKTEVHSDFKGEKWSSHSSPKNNDDKWAAARKHDLWLIGAKYGDGFNLTGHTIHYGRNSGFQAINLALLFGATTIVLDGFVMKGEKGSTHFFGDHAEPLHNNHPYGDWLQEYEKAAALLPLHLQIINCTPDTALSCFTRMSLGELLGQTGTKAA